MRGLSLSLSLTTAWTLLWLFQSVLARQTQGRAGPKVWRYSSTPSTSSLKTYRGVTKHPICNNYSPDNTRFNDPRWREQWYAQDYRTAENMPVMDLNLVPVYDTQNSGQGIIVGIIGDGVDSSHEDLNVNRYVGYNVCKKKQWVDPTSAKDRYGTLVAGVIAMQADNNKCGVGVAYSAMVTGITGFCRGKSEYPAAESFTHNKDKIHIYVSALSSKYFYPQSAETDSALDNGLLYGRDTKGAIYIFPAGNNGIAGESCAGGSHLNYHNVIGVNGASEGGKVLSYGEQCAAIYATAYAAETNGICKGIISTTPSSTCQANIPGTWSAAGFAAGIIALVLQAKPSLTTRDVIHIITQSAEVAPLADNDESWRKNGAGFWVSHNFGFGLLNAQNMVNLATNWKPVGEEIICDKNMKPLSPVIFKVGEWNDHEMIIDGCEITFLEELIIKLNIKFPSRGALEIRLLSEKGTEAHLLNAKMEDTNTKGILNWSFKSVHFWGENPTGIWKLRLRCKIETHCFSAMFPWVDESTLKLEDVRFIAYGLRSPPESLGSGSRSYTAFRLKNGVSSHPDVNDEMYLPLGTISTRPTSAALSLYPGVTEHPIYDVNMEPSAYRRYFDDPMWFTQWYAQDYRLEKSPVMDLNLVPVYKMSITGKGVNIAIVSDGVFSDHLDIQRNYVHDLSLDTCKGVQNATPYNEDQTMGTLTAGLIAMRPNNGICGVGVAYDARVTGIKLYCYGAAGVYNHERMAISLIYKMNEFDIYNHAWSNVSMGPLPVTIRSAIENSLQLGRGRKGVIHVIPSGTNEKHKSCAVDHFFNHHGVIVVNGASMGGKILQYGQSCTAILATAYSAQSRRETIYSTSSNNQCAAAPRGTYTAAAFASGIIALLLEAKPDLTYRDVMHIIAMGAEVAPLADNPAGTWYKNQAGFWVSRHFGFGLLNAENMVLLAKRWVTVPDLSVCTEKFSSKGTNLGKPWRILRDMYMEFNACQGTTNKVLNLEQIEVSLKFPAPLKTLEVHLTSPRGTKVVLFDDHSTTGFEHLSIKSVHTWGEDPDGSWNIEFVKASAVRAVVPQDSEDHVTEITLTAYGTRWEPLHYYKRMPRAYAAFRLQDGEFSGPWPDEEDTAGH